MSVETSPHKFVALSWWDVFRQYGRCQHCFLPKFAHPVHCWVPARPYGNKAKAAVNWANLNGETTLVYSNIPRDKE